jgi:hypothetical protein
MVVLPSTSALRYKNCCIDGGTSPENFGYYLVCKLVYPTLDNLESSINWKFIEASYISIPFATITQKRFWELKK